MSERTWSAAIARDVTGTGAAPEPDRLFNYLDNCGGSVSRRPIAEQNEVKDAPVSRLPDVTACDSRSSNTTVGEVRSQSVFSPTCRENIVFFYKRQRRENGY